MFTLKVLSINLKFLAPLCHKISNSFKSSSKSKVLTFSLIEERQNSHSKGQPRDAST